MILTSNPCQTIKFNWQQPISRTESGKNVVKLNFDYSSLWKFIKVQIFLSFKVETDHIFDGVSIFK